MILKMNNGKLELCNNDGTRRKLIESQNVVDADINNDETLIVVTYKNGKVKLLSINGTLVHSICEKANKARFQGDGIVVNYENGRIKIHNKNGSIIRNIQ